MTESSTFRFTEQEEGFYRLLLQLLSYKTILAVEWHPWCGTAPTSGTHLYAFGGITCSRDETATGC